VVFRPYTLEEGAFLVRLARRAVEHYLRTGELIRPPPETPAKFLADSYGVFTTIETMTEKRTFELRGCIGFPRGYRNVAEAVIASSVAACCEDPRFPPMRLEELSRVVFEVSILSPLKELRADPRELPKLVEVGRHGLVVERFGFSGLLLPQVPVEYCWDSETFLMEACMKAMLPGDCWLDKRTRIYVFEAQLFREAEPGGEIYERDLASELSRCGK